MSINQTCPYNLDETPVKIGPFQKVSKINNLIKAILLNNDIQPHLSLINKTVSGWSPLMIAALNTNVCVPETSVEKLIDHGARLDYQENTDRNTVLMLASMYSGTFSTENTVHMILNAGAQIDQKNKKGHTALILASSYVDVFSTDDTVRILINAGANIDTQQEDGITPLMWIFDGSCSIDAAKMLLSAGANLNIYTTFGKTVLMIAIEKARTFRKKAPILLVINHFIKHILQSNVGYMEINPILT